MSDLGKAGISDENVRALREAHRQGVPYAELARRFGISKIGARLIAKGRRRKNVN